MVSAEEHFNRTLDVFRTHAHTQRSADVDPESIRFSKEEIAYVRLFAFFLSSLLFFSFSLRARAPQTTKQK